MKIGIIVAMQKELKLLLPLIQDIKEQMRDGIAFHHGKIGTHEVTLAECGIGKVNAALTTVTLIKGYGPELVINSGVAGGADKSMHILDLLVAEGVAYHDVWCGPGTEYGAASGFDVIMKPWPELVEKAHEVLSGDKIRYGLICSGDKFISQVEEVREIKSHFPTALAVDMESAAIAQTCFRFGVPFNILRVISDTPGEAENISQYENFWGDAPKETFGALVSLLEAIG